MDWLWLWALLLLIGLSIFPSVLFLLFWRFLLWLRDDALIEQLQLTHGFDLSPAAVNPLASERTASVTACPHCGTQTPADATHCVLCQQRLP